MQPIDIDRARQAAQLSAVSYDFPFNPPTTHEIHNFLSRAAPSAPGIDGLPYQAWLSAGQDGLLALHRAGVALCAWEHLSRDFNFTTFVFTRKKPTPRVLQGEAIRAPLETRSIGLKNTDSKIVAAAASRQALFHLKDTLAPQQRGFIPRRNFLANVVELDLAARAPTSTTPNPITDKQPLLHFADFGQAFPSVLHSWLRTVLLLANAPLGFVSFMLTLLQRAMAVSPTPNGLVKLFPLRCGVIQGDPRGLPRLPARLRPVHQAHGPAPGDGQTRPRARLRRRPGLRPPLGRAPLPLFLIIALAKEAAGLTRKVAKCVIVIPTQWSEEGASQLLDTVLACVPEWGGIGIASHARYLGFTLGPQARGHLWTGAAHQFLARVVAIAKGAALHPSRPPSTTCRRSPCSCTSRSSRRCPSRYAGLRDLRSVALFAYPAARSPSRSSSCCVAGTAPSSAPSRPPRTRP